MGWLELGAAVVGGMLSADASASEGKKQERIERLERDKRLIRDKALVRIAESRRKAANLARQRANVSASNVLLDEALDLRFEQFAAKEQVILKAQRDIAKVTAKAATNPNGDTAGVQGTIEQITNRSELELLKIKKSQEKTERSLINRAGGIQSNYINGYDGNVAQEKEFKLFKRDTGGKALMSGINAFVSLGGVNATGSLLSKI